jgi:beta-glucanase (GH16 family)
MFVGVQAGVVRIALAMSLLCVAQLARAEAATPVPLGIPDAAGYRLIKNWDFKRTIRTDEQLRREFFTRFIYANGTQDHLNDEWERYRDNHNHRFTAKGLSLVAVCKKLEPGGIESGMLRSRWSGKYGVYEIRMKVPAGRGTWPAFWLGPEDGVWPPEIDIVEVVNDGREGSHQSFHFVHGAGAKLPATFSRLGAGKAFAPGVDFSKDYHTFSIVWTEGSVEHYVDGKLTVSRPYRWVHNDESDGGPAHVLVNLAVGGQWPGPPSKTGSLPATLDIEYIRVWQR